MGAVELRDIVLKYIHTADDRLLRVVKAHAGASVYACAKNKRR